MHIYLLNQTADGFIELYQTVSSKMNQKKDSQIVIKKFIDIQNDRKIYIYTKIERVREGGGRGRR